MLAILVYFLGRFPSFQLSPQWIGVLGMLVATACFAGLGIFVRLLTPAIHPLEIAFFRNLFGLVALSPLLVRSGWNVLKTNHLPLYGLRGILTVLGMGLSFLAFSVLPQAEATALSFSELLFSSALALWILREPLSWSKATGLALGLLGTIVILRPGYEVISVGAIWVLVGAVMFAGSVVLLKIVSPWDSSLTITAYMAIIQTPLSLLAALWVWQWPSPQHLLLLLAMGTVGNAGHLALAQAFKATEATTVLPLGFARLLWASALGYWFFEEVPEPWVGLGGILVFAGGILPSIATTQRSPSPHFSQK